jgi:two-component system NtrC family sensor kinase
MDSLLQLMQRKPDRLRPDAIQTLRDQVQRINQIIQQMKTFAHPVETQTQTVAVNDVIDASVDMLRFDKRMKTVKIEKRLSPDVGQLSFMPQALQQVLVNLIVNALDAISDAPSPTILVRSERRDSHVLIEVADNGTGISEEHMARLFEPFFTTKPLGKGTGLGLSISYTLIQKQGGHITARSEVGKGTTFTVRLPAPHHSRTREAPPPALAVSENRLP